MSEESLHLVCPHCSTVNRIFAQKLKDSPNCGQCKQPLFNGEPAELTAANFDRHISRNDLPVVVDFWAPWCGPCRALAPRLEQLARQFEGQVQVRKLNVDDAPELATAHGVRGIPTLILFKGGQAHSRLVGLHDETQLSSWVRAAL